VKAAGVSVAATPGVTATVAAAAMTTGRGTCAGCTHGDTQNCNERKCTHKERPPDKLGVYSTTVEKCAHHVICAAFGSGSLSGSNLKQQPWLPWDGQVRTAALSVCRTIA
jgi:hypothetical protein